VRVAQQSIEHRGGARLVDGERRLPFASNASVAERPSRPSNSADLAPHIPAFRDLMRFAQATSFGRNRTRAATTTVAALLGTFYPKATLLARKIGGDGRPFMYMRLTLTNSVFTGFQTGGSSGSSILPFEQVSMQPSSVKFEAFDQDLVGGGSDQVATNTVTCQNVT
jgi:hypothetical protein